MKGKKLNENEKQAKMSVVKAMRDMAMEEMGGKVGSLKKVTVASPDESGLKEGLEKAKELIEAKSDSEEKCECGMEGCEKCEEYSSEESDESEEMSEEELNAKLEKLMKLKERMKKAE